MKTCKVGGLSEKHGELSLTSGTTSRFFFTDVNLPLSGSNSIVENLSQIVISDSDQAEDPLTCTSFGRTILAIFDGADGVSGTVTFTQKSRTEMVEVALDLDGLDSRASGLYVRFLAFSQHLPFSNFALPMCSRCKNFRNKDFAMPNRQETFTQQSFPQIQERPSGNKTYIKLATTI